MLLSIPDDLTTVNEGTLVGFVYCLGPSQGGDDDASFRVICVAWYNTKLVVFTFSSVTRRWGIATSSSWSSLGTEPPNRGSPRGFDYVDGCFYWTVHWADKILMLDALKMKFSIINYSHCAEDRLRACVAVDREGNPGMLTVAEYIGNKKFRFSALRNRVTYFILGAAEGFIFLRGDVNFSVFNDIDYFSLNVKTAEFEYICGMAPDKCYFHVCPYFRFPPASAKPYSRTDQLKIPSVHLTTMKGYTARLADEELDLEPQMESDTTEEALMLQGGADELHHQQQQHQEEEEAGSVRCECCGMAEDCTPGYVRRVRAWFEGRLVCGLCAEAVSERRRCDPALAVGEAVESHATLCDRFNNTVRLNPTLSLARSMRDIARTSCISRRRSGESPRPAAPCGASNKIGRVQSCPVRYPYV
uniref:Uncharacterized protein n=1 Tax=Leersia perrieri TaxID=77586 RepID=A0A0D9V5J6_9ORYZ